MATLDDASFNSRVRSMGSPDFTRVVGRPSGTNISYFCSVHGGPGGVGMAGVVHII